MRRFRLSIASLCVAASATLAWILGDWWGTHHADTRSQRAEQSQAEITEVVSYRDSDFDFLLAVPAGWKAIVASPETVEADGLSVAHTVSFEAPREYPGDVFSDYVMIEIIPGERSGKFVTDGSKAKNINIDGYDAVRESLVVEQHRLGDETLDLIIHQAEIRATGFTVGFYAIGEPRNRAFLDDAFELMIRSFEFVTPPYRVS